MNYISHKRFKTLAICGQVNIPAMTKCAVENGIITLDGKQLCSIFSENAHQFFAINDDGNGLVRGGLTSRITKKLTTKDNEYQDRWDIIWEDELCQKYRRPEHKDHWLWNHHFYNASIEDLTYIAKIIGA